MHIKNKTAIQISQGILVFLIYWAAKKPLIFIMEGYDWSVITLLGLLLISMTVLFSLILIKMRRVKASLYHLSIMLALLPVSLLHGNDFGVYKVFSIVLMLNLVVLVYVFNSSLFDLRKILSTMAAIFVLYGVFSITSLFLLSGNLWGRGVIGFNGPIVFGQYMIIAFTILLLYEKRLIAFLALAMSFISQSKGPALAGMVSLIISSRNKFVVIFVLFLTAIFAIFVLDSRVLSWIWFFVENGSLPESGSFSARLNLYGLGYDLLNESSLGLGGWSAVSEYPYPHNIFLEVFVELPLVLSVILLLTNILAFCSIKDFRYRVLFVIFLFMAQFSGSIIDNRGVFLITILFLLSTGNRVYEKVG